MSLLTAFLISVLVLYLIYRYLYKRPANYPPGPRGFPLVGYFFHLFRLHRCCHLAMDIISRKYGNLVGIYFGPVPILMACRYDAVKAVLTNEDFDGRPTLAPTLNAYKKKGIMFADGDSWRRQRSFTMRHLRAFGFGRNGMDEVIHEEIQELITQTRNEMEKTTNHAMQMKQLFTPSMFNVLWRIIGGIRYKLDDKKVAKLLHIFDEYFQIGNIMGVVNIFPTFNKIFPNLFNFGEMQKLAGEVVTFLQDIIKEHQATFDPNHTRDFIDAYLLEMQEQKDNGLSLDELTAVLIDMLIGGSETGQATLNYAFLFMALYPDVQKKVQKELDDVIGKDRLPLFEDRKKLTYTYATVVEVFRLGTVGALAGPHVAMKDTRVQGYDIPKGTICGINLWSVLMEKEYWGDPEVFRPERHIDSNGKLKKSDHLLTFGAGNRVCPGESLGWRSMFLFFAGFMQAFKFTTLPGEELPDTTDPLPGIVVKLPAFKLKFDSRY